MKVKVTEGNRTIEFEVPNDVPFVKIKEIDDDGEGAQRAFDDGYVCGLRAAEGIVKKLRIGREVRYQERALGEKHTDGTRIWASVVHLQFAEKAIEKYAQKMEEDNSKISES
jgi:hypothetical protein